MTLPGPTKDYCGCGCGLFGGLGRPRRDGSRHVRLCVCRSCLGKRNRAKGDSKARNARKALSIDGVNSRHEEHWGGYWRTEVKAGAQIKAAATAFLRTEKQSEASRPIGDNRPYRAVFMPDGMSDGIVSVRLSVWRDHIEPRFAEVGE